MERACKDCDYWEAVTMYCRRNSPRLGKVSTSPYPNTGPTGWCGEFAPKGTWQRLAKLLDSMEADTDWDKALLDPPSEV